MKKIFNYIMALSAVGILLTACDKSYLDTAPTDQVPADDAIKTTTNGWAAINGIHRLMYSQWLGNQDQGGQSGNMLYMDVMGDDVVMTAQSNGWLISECKWLSHRIPTSRVPQFNYQFYYAIIGNANNIIANIDAATGVEADKKVIKGQALAYRAWSYFQMIQLFGKRYVKGQPNDGLGLPLVLKASTTATPRSTVAQVYDQINKDLDDAITALTGAAARANASHINLNVAKGFKARVALAQQNWPVAAQLAAEARGNFTLMSAAQILGGFNDYSNSEWMWGSHQQSDQTTYFYSFFAFMSCNYGSTNVRGNPKAIFSKLYNLISATDARKGLWDPTGANTSFPIPLNPAGVRKPYMNRKFISAGGEGSSIGDVPLMRVAEMYLIEAEARARNGEDVLAAAALFTLAKARDASYVMSTNTGQALIDEIMIQRRVELWGEGFRFYDLKRTNSALDRTGGNHDGGLTGGLLTLPANDIKWEFVIPQAEINNTNGVVVQNPL